MSRGFSQETLDEVLSRIDIVELISGYMPLKRAGRNFKAVCPFHKEKTPSFMVNPDKQIYHCFGCGIGGNAFNFLMRYERIEFPEAVEQLARKAGVVLPDKVKNSQPQNSNSYLYKINELAAIFYRNILNSPEGNVAKEYLVKRGVKEQSVEEFRLGFAPQKWDGLLNFLKSKGAPLALLEKSGLIIPKDGGGYYDRFRGRIIFPVCDIKNRVIAFGARVLPGKDEDAAKYINSPETPIYIKGRNLFGLNLARESIVKFDCALIVEGYLDLLIAYQEGVRNVIASQGTALTPEQARLLKRYTHNAVMVYDGDSAGESATLRSLDIFLEEEIDVRIVSLPKGFDPDTYIRSQGADKFRELAQDALTLFEYKLGVLKSRYDSRSIESKVKIAAEMLATIRKVKNAVLKSEYVKRLAEDLDIKEESLFQELKKIKGYPLHQDETVRPVNRIQDISPTEKLLLRFMLQEAGIMENLKGHIEPADFQDEVAAKIVSLILSLVSEGKPAGPSHIINYFQDDDVCGLIGELTMYQEHPTEGEKKNEIINDCIRRLKSKRLRIKKERLSEEIKMAEASKDDERLVRLTQEFQQLVRGGV